MRLVWQRWWLACMALLVVTLSARAEVEYPAVVPGYTIALPRDEGSHPLFRTEWWYLTGWLDAGAGKSFGFQITFFRHRPGNDEANPSRFAAKQLLFAHASLSDPANGKLLRAEKVARAGFDLAEARAGALDVHIDQWKLRRQDATAVIEAEIAGAEFSFALRFAETQAPLLHGREGYSQKTPDPDSVSYYYSLPQLQASGRIVAHGKSYEVRGVAWLDHEWFGDIFDDDSQGWDWTGLNLDDGSSLMALQMRNARGEQHWAAATVRDSTGVVRTLAPAEVEWRSERQWRSPRTGIRYPVEVRVRLGERTIHLRPLLDDQENDARASTGTIYWEGAMRALDGEGRQIGRGYLEMTGYGDRIRF